MKYLILIACLFLVSGSTSCNKSHEPVTKQEAARTDQIGRRWNRVDTADETVRGIRLQFKFDDVTDAFIGTLENTTKGLVPKVRAKVRVFDSENNTMEYGPTAPKDLQPAEKIEIILAAPGFDDFVAFTIHPEMG